MTAHLNPAQPESGHAPWPETDPDIISIEAVRRGEVAAFDDLARRHQPKILNVVRRITRNEEDAEDVAQEALLRAFKRLDTFRGDSLFSTWLTRIAVNLALMKVRSRKVQITSLDHDSGSQTGEAILQVRDNKPTPAAECLQRELQAILIELIGQLSPRYRVVLHMRDVEEFSIEETATALGLSISAVKSRHARARLHLRRSLNKRYRRKAAGRHLRGKQQAALLEHS